MSNNNNNNNNNSSNDKITDNDNDEIFICPYSYDIMENNNNNNNNNNHNNNGIIDNNDKEEILRIKSKVFFKRSGNNDSSTIRTSITDSRFENWYFLYWLSILCTCGMILIFYKWYPEYEMKMKYIRCLSHNAEFVLIISMHNEVTICDILIPEKKILSSSSTLQSHYKIDWIPLHKINKKKNKKKKKDEEEEEGMIHHENKTFFWRNERFWYNDDDDEWYSKSFNSFVSYNSLHAIASKRVNEMNNNNNNNNNDNKVTNNSTGNIDREVVYGLNHCDIGKKTISTIFLDEFLQPFYLFQIFSIIVWIQQKYVIYSMVILILMSMAVMEGTYSEYQNRNSIRKLAMGESSTSTSTSTSEEQEENKKQGQYISSIQYDFQKKAFIEIRKNIIQLYPGDVIEIKDNDYLPCDVVLLTGSVVLSEAMLTGESAPVIKVSLPYDDGNNNTNNNNDNNNNNNSIIFNQNMERDRKHILFGGTHVIQSKRAYSSSSSSTSSSLIKNNNNNNNNNHNNNNNNSILDYELNSNNNNNDNDDNNDKQQQLPVMGLVLNTAFRTVKGELIRSILYPRPPKYEFKKQANAYILFMIIITFIGSLTQIMQFMELHVPIKEAILMILNMITISIPPALPLALSIGTSISFYRLQKQGIFCTSSTRIVPAGRVNCLCYDKTGTLTEDKMTFKGAYTVIDFDYHRTTSYSNNNNNNNNNNNSVTSGSKIDMSPFMKPQDIFPFHVHNNNNNNNKDNKDNKDNKKKKTIPNKVMTSFLMTSCHGLALIRKEEKTHGRVSKKEKDDECSSQMKTKKKDKNDIDEIELGVIRKNSKEEEEEEEEEEKNNKYSLEIVGDSLEVEILKKTDWTIVSRHIHNNNNNINNNNNNNNNNNKSFERKMKNYFNGDSSSSSSISSSSIWYHPGLPPHVDTVLLPPKTALLNGHLYAIAILKRFDFDADLRYMACIVKILRDDGGPLEDEDENENENHGSVYLFMKGAPEIMNNFCNKNTIPERFSNILHKTTYDGNRVLGCGFKKLTMKNFMSRSKNEMIQDLQFLGLLVMQNNLKKESIGYLNKYHKVGFRQIIVTGDNPMTAASISKQAGTVFLKNWRVPMILDIDESVKTDKDIEKLLLYDMIDRNKKYSYINTIKQMFVKKRLLLEEEEEERDIDIDIDTNTHTDATNGELAFSFIQDLEFDIVCTGGAFGLLLHEHNRLRGKSKDADGEQWTAFELLLLRCNIFARMLPWHKEELMRSLQRLELVVCMTGDGANDACALKAADVGISISSKSNNNNELEIEAHDINDDDNINDEHSIEKIGHNMNNFSDKKEVSENSILAAPSIAAPFVTALHHIGIIEILIGEGRCALVTSFSMFKYMFLYGIIQYTVIYILYSKLREFSDNAYLYNDLFLVTPLTLLIPMMKPMTSLQKAKPDIDLFSPNFLRSIFGHCAIIISFSLICKQVMESQDGYIYVTTNNLSAGSVANDESYEASVLFLFSNYPLISTAFALVQTYGNFRQQVFSAFPLLICFIVQSVLTITITLIPSNALARALQFDDEDLTLALRFEIFILGLVLASVQVLYDRFLVPHASSDEEPIDLASETFEDTIPKPKKCNERIDDQPTYLPKLRRKAPIYHIGNLFWEK